MKFFRLLACALLLSGAGLAAPHQPVDPHIQLEMDDGFCEDGSYFLLKPIAGDPPKVKIWGGFCHAAYKDTAIARTSAFVAPKYLRIYSIGATKSPKLWLERVSDGIRFLIVPFDEDMQRWSASDYVLPPDWQGKPVRLVAEGAPERGLWRAFSEPIEGESQAAIGDAFHILGLTALHYSALMICALALTALAVLFGVRDRIQAGLITLAATAVPGYFVFWLTLWTPRANRFYAMAAIMSALVGLIVYWRKLDQDGRAILRWLMSPLLLTGAVGLMVLSSGFLYGGLKEPLGRACTRFLPRLPPDNEIPLLLAQGARLPHVPTPLQGDWLSSDRPPLQSGIVLAHFPLFRRPREQGYTVLSALAQSLWILGLWLLLTAFKLNPRAIVLALATCLFTGFVFMNTFFVWPKLLAAAYALGFLAAFARGKSTKDSHFLNWAVPGALLAFSLLAHGGAIFALLPAVPLILLWKRPCPISSVTKTVLFGLLCYSPWMLYQKFYDPPGNHLLKMHLAGVEHVDKRSFSETLRASYGAHTWTEILNYKEQNFQFAFGEGLSGLEKTGELLKALTQRRNWPDAAERGLQLREQMFFHPAVCLGLFLFAPFALLAGFARRFRTAEWRTACVFWLFATTANAVWCLLMFGPSTTSIHQGAYANMLLLIVAGVLSFWSIWPPLAVAVSISLIGVNFLINEPLQRVAYPNGRLPEGLLHVDTLALLCASIAAVLWLLRRMSQETVRDQCGAD